MAAKRMGLVLLVVLAACAPKRLEPGSLRDVHRLAILVRVESGPTVEAAKVEPREGRAFPQATPEEADRRLAEALGGQVGGFEVEERFRAALLAKLPPSPPWTEVMSPVEVATALDALLVRDRTAPIDLGALARAGADAVLLLQVREFGVHRVGQKTGLFARGEGRLFKMDGTTLWKASLDLDDAAPASLAEGLDVVALRDGAFKEAMIDFIGRLAARTANQLAGQGDS
jgi:hypothetical protein